MCPCLSLVSHRRSAHRHSVRRMRQNEYDGKSKGDGVMGKLGEHLENLCEDFS